MKKRLMLFVAFISMALMATGCMDSPKKVLEKSSKNMSELDNYKMTMKMNMGVKSSGIEMNIPITIEADVDEKNKFSYMDTTVEMFGMKVSTESYLDYSDKNNTITYTKSMGENTWIMEEDEESSNLTEIQEIVTKGTKVEKKDTDEKDTLYYQVTISKEDVQKLLEANASANEDMTEDMKIEDDVVVDVYINKSKKLIKKIYIDFSKFVKMEEEDTELTKFDFEINFDEYNKVGDVKIPKEVIENAE